MRERGPLWEQFTVLSAAKGGGPGRVMCKSCDWTGAANSTRMRLHALEEHPPSTAPASMQCPAPASTQSPASTPIPAASESTHAAVTASQAALKQQRRHVYHLQKKRQRSLSDFCDRKISGDEQTAASKAQCLMVVMAGLSYHSQDNPATHAFFRSLRSDYKPPTRHLLEKHLRQLETEVRSEVLAKLKSVPHVSMAFDGWEDHQKCPSLGFTIVTPNMEVFLWKLVRIAEKQTAPHLCQELKIVVDELQHLGVRVISACADNASNCQKALSLAEEEYHLLKGNCFAHTMNLLLEDIGSLFALQFEQLREVNNFFRNRHGPRIAYEVAQEKCHGTRLVQPGETRWGSNVDLAVSVLQNRKVIDMALAELRHGRFIFKKKELAFLLYPDWWDSIDKMATVCN